jgi:hypothetical protein
MGEWYPVCQPTCEKDGENRRNCNRCSYEEVETVAAHGHSYSSETVPPGCTEQGYTTYSCPACGHRYVDDYVDMLGHTETVDAAVEPTCTEIGLTEGKHCSVCMETLIEQEIVPARGHSYEFTEIKPTCVDEGYTVYSCHCGDSYEKRLEALGHTPSEWIVDTEPQIGVAGRRHKDCLVCGELLEIEDMEALTDVSSSDAFDTDVPHTENSTVKPEPSDGCNGILSVPMVLLALFSWLAVAWHPRKKN